MNCKLCDRSLSDFIIMGVCGRCIDGLIIREVKARARAAAPSAIETIERFVGDDSALRTEPAE